MSEKKNDPVDGQIVAAIEELGEVITDEAKKNMARRLDSFSPSDYAIRVERREVTDWQVVEEVKCD